MGSAQLSNVRGARLDPARGTIGKTPTLSGRGLHDRRGIRSGRDVGRTVAVPRDAERREIGKATGRADLGRDAGLVLGIGVGLGVQRHLLHRKGLTLAKTAQGFDEVRVGFGLTTALHELNLRGIYNLELVRSGHGTTFLL